jgi:hypothetical protein
MWHAWGGERCLQGFGWEARKEETTARPRHRWEDNIKMDLREMGIHPASYPMSTRGFFLWGKAAGA